MSKGSGVQVMMPILHQSFQLGCHRNLRGKILSWCVDNKGMAAATAATGSEAKTSVFGSKDFLHIELWGPVMMNKKHHTSRIDGAAQT